MSNWISVTLGLFLLFTVAHTASSAHNNPCQSANFGARLRSLSDISFTATDANYTYNIRVCHDVKNHAGAAIVQHDKKHNKDYVIGRSANFTVKAGSNWMLLTYADGDAYHTHCNKMPRQGLIMLTCAAATSNTVAILEEYREKSPAINDCYYLFEMISNVACGNDQRPPLPLSPGSIFVVVVISLVAGILILGMLVKAIVLGARGRDAVPCLNFWTTFFTLQADGCDYICRCKKSFTTTGDWDNRDADYSPELFQDKKSTADDRLLAP